MRIKKCLASFDIYPLILIKLVFKQLWPISDKCLCSVLITLKLPHESGSHITISEIKHIAMFCIRPAHHCLDRDTVKSIIHLIHLFKRDNRIRIKLSRTRHHKKRDLYLCNVIVHFLQDSKISYKKDSTEQYFIKLFTHLKNHSDICLAMHNAGLIYLIKDEFDHIFLTLHKDEYDEYKSYFLAGGIYNIFLLWLIHGCKETPEQLAAKLNNILER